MTIDRPPRERYVRYSIEVDEWITEPAIEWRDGDDYLRILVGLERCARFGVMLSESSTPRHAMNVAELVGARMAELWPDRAYFVEVWQGGTEGFAQVFQPFGVPRNEPQRSVVSG